MALQVDALVLGAGAVGTAVALHLQRRGMEVVLVDRRDPGEETSFGNAGLLERATLVPYAFPRSVWKLARYARNRRSDMRYDLLHLPRIALWLVRYWWHSQQDRLSASADALLPLIEDCLRAHEELAEVAEAKALIRKEGWVEPLLSPQARDEAQARIDAARKHSVTGLLLGRERLVALEPCVSTAVETAIHWIDPWTVLDPGALLKAHAAALVRLGGTFLRGDAATLSQENGLWQVESTNGPASAPRAVVAMGPWSADLTSRLGYRVPLITKRGYHMHYGLENGSSLRRPILDEEGGYVLAPMTRGIRLTTGIEFAAPDAPPNTIQLDRAELRARHLLPALGERLDPHPWLGRRPCLPDMRPIIGPAPRQEGLWFCFGHAHHGLTLGPVSGLLLAQLVTGEKPFADPTPFAVTRFRS
ncbi:NAD(P)/FAD-dependent oxidoreductase [Aquibaculum arenosum]|nr:FAD-binding oxidoreductase [Fodinicurvata sp. CAU 1616]